MKNIIIESVAWDKKNKEASNTDNILIGTRNSCIYVTKFEMNMKDVKILKLLFDFNSRIDVLMTTGPITGLNIESENGKYFILASTPLRIFQFVGSTSLDDVFDSYSSQKLLAYFELPFVSKRTTGNTELHIFSRGKKLAESFAWLSLSGIYHGTFNYQGVEKAGQKFINETQILQFEKPFISMSITEFHIMVLYDDKIQILMQPTSLIFTKQVQLKNIKIAFEKSIENPKGICRDGMDYFIYGDSAVYRVMIDDETKEIWRLYLEKAIDPNTSQEKYFDIALKLCRDSPKDSDLVLTSKGDYYFKMNKFEESADIYAKTYKSFEQIAIAYHNKGERDALCRFLRNKLKEIISKRKNDKQDTTQISCLCTWLTEIYLDKMNSIDKNNIQQLISIRNIFRQFLEENKDFLNQETTFRLISSHGQMEEMRYYALLISDFERVINQCLIQNEYKEALDILSKNCKDQKYQEHFYKFAPVLIQQLPRETIEVLMQNKNLNPGRLIPALMRIIEKEKQQVTVYLEWAIKYIKNQEPAIHNLLLSLYAQEKDDKKLLAFLNFDNENNFYDPRYALRVCTKNNQTESCVRLYALMGLYEDAVDLALNHKNIKLAREIADQPEENEYKKKLWLKIAKFVIQVDNNISKAIEFLKLTDKIKLEDVLPFFPDFVLIDNFKEQVCKTLEEYKTEIEELKQDMVESTQNANYIREDIKELKHRFGFVTKNAKCCYNDCFQTVLSKEFYMFPCQHMFHTNCLIQEIKKHASNTRILKIDQLLVKISQNDMNSTKELDEIISKECPLCGDIMIDSIDLSFSKSEELGNIWKL